MRERPVRDLEIPSEELVQPLDRGLVDVEHEELLRRGGLEVRLGLGMMLLPVLQPALLELTPVANAVLPQGLEVGGREAALVVLETRADPVEGIAVLRMKRASGYARCSSRK